ncbi:B3 domain-containing protein Os02g0683500-like [Phragmites australis]|uniref:B3 domain-containing protein Os02g0683500-like n=1 Tax=Phragmites australis TaxID=29695 RepID=UPI002D77B65E|nr:B3 domain-containing protein Os02g0683500-like [Phragmites australis]
MELHEKEKAPSREVPFLALNPVSSQRYVSAWAASASASLSASALRGSNNMDTEVIEVEHLFSKILTPSDIGKLNRFLIPRRNAEKYFPMAASRPKSNRVSFLTFEDCSTGKLWHFRYCFWSSSRGYVLTKCWKAFVRIKELNAGDLVSIYRGAGEAAGNRRFIRCRKRAGVSAPHPTPAAVLRGLTPAPSTPYVDQPLRQGLRFRRRRSIYGSGPARQHPLCYGSAGTQVPQPPIAPESATLGNGKAVAEKRVRLFGVNLVIPDPGSAA